MQNEAILQIRMEECSQADARQPYTEVDGDNDNHLPMEDEDASEQLTISSQLKRDIAGETLNTLKDQM